MTQKLERGQTYHIYNRGNNRENLFREQRNYPYFLTLYRRHILPIAHTYAYCLLKNHFHLLVTLKTEAEIGNDLTNSSLTTLEIARIINRSPSRAFANLFNAYTKSINHAYGRTGTLFERPFRRRLVDSAAYFYRLIIYIHQNPQHHGFVKDFRDWPYTSYNAIISEQPTQTARQQIRQQFGGVQSFIQQHQALIDLDLKT